MKSEKALPLFPGCESITDTQKRDLCSSESFVAYLRERLEVDKDVKGKAAIRLHIDAVGEIDRPEFHPRSHPVLSEQIALVIQQMQEEDFR